MKRVNIIYDFDGTLTNSGFPKYLFLEKYGYKNGTLNKDFIEPFIEKLKDSKIDGVVEYYNYLFEFLEKHNINITFNDFLFGIDKIDFNNGLDEYFEEINKIAKENDIELKHYVATSGIKEFVENSKYANYFDKVFGSTLKIENNFILGMKHIISMQEKIDNLEELFNETKPNETIYIGDGLTDKFAMEYTKQIGGKNILVHQENVSNEIYEQINQNKIVDYYEFADYGKTSKLFEVVKNIIVK